jgi:tetratricopeptide (TPR) repeat protein/plasmid stabilization system protein ParE
MLKWAHIREHEGMTVSPELIEHLLHLPIGGCDAVFLEHNSQLLNRTTVLEIADQVNQIAREDLDKAETLANLVAWLSELANDEFCRAKSLRSLGNVKVLRNDYQQAVELFERSLEICRRLAIEREEAATLSAQLQPLMYLGRYEEAFSKANLARQIALRLGDELLLARIGINFGNILHRLDRFSEARANYETAVDTLNKLGQQRDCAVAYLNLAVCYISLNDFAKAEEAYGRARSLAVSQNMPTLVTQADYNIAYLYYHRGEYAKAIELYQQTKIHCQQTGDVFHRALCDLDQAEIYLDLHLHREAMDLAAQANESFERLQMRYEATKALVWLAIAHYQSGRRLRALELLATARERMRTEGNKAWTAALDLYQALILQQEGRFYEALRECNRSLAEFPEGSHKAIYAKLAHSSLHLATGRLTEARTTAESILASAEKLNSSQLLANAYLNLGRCKEALNCPQDAIRFYEESSMWFEQIPIQAGADGLKIASTNKREDVYDSWLNLAASARNTIPAETILRVIEKSRSREIAELISCRSNSLKTPSDGRSVLVEQLRALREDLSWYYHCSDNADLAGKTDNPVPAEQLSRSIREREKSLSQTLGAMREIHEEFHSLQAATGVPVEQIRSRLSEDEILLELFQARGSIYALLLTRGTCKVVPLTRCRLLRDHLRDLHSCFAGMSSVHKDSLALHQPPSRKSLRILNSLYKDLVEPIVEEIRGRRLIIAPEGPLRYVPMHALFDGKNFVIDSFTLSYAGSASLHYLSSKKLPIRKGRHILITSGRVSRPQLFSFSGFIHVRDLHEIGAESVSNRCVHLDCHLSPRFDNPMFSSVTIGEDTKTILDLFNADYTCSVLGVTGAAPGIRADGEGSEFEGLARAFEYAGARTLILSLWDTHAESTNLFFETFYQEAFRCEDLSVAYRSTLGRVRAEYPDPFYWGPFLLRGQSRHNGFEEERTNIPTRLEKYQ